MVRSVLAAALVLTALLVVQLPAGDCGAEDICFSNSDCTGAQITAGSAEDCCVGTDDGLSYGTPGDCRECIVHGFDMAAYSTDENSAILTGTFGLNRKGVTSVPLIGGIPGRITSMGITATESQDYGRLVVDVGITDRVVSFELDLINDNLALEFVEKLSLNFTVDRNFRFLSLYLDAEDFIRDSVIVSIDDTDEKLEINFDEQDRSEIENAAIPLENEVTLSLRPTQIPFTIEVIHEAITGVFNESRATPDEDFVAFSYMLEIPAMTETITLSNVSILDDNINEAEEVFAVVIRLVVAESTACFQQQIGGECFGNTGRIIIRIRDNDPMLIGFGTRNTTIRENRFPFQDSFAELFNVISFRTSELVYEMTFSVTGQRNAEVVAENETFSTNFPNWDVSFGSRLLQNEPPFILLTLDPGLRMLARDLQLTIHNDFNAEETEFFTLRITARDVGRGVFDCYDDTEERVLGDFFCSHTFFIVDEDIPLNVSFVETVYTVVERDERVEVCVTLTQPLTDILDNFVLVEAFVDDDSIYIPPNASIATGRLPPPFLPEPSQPFDEGFNEDYPQQLLGVNDLRAIQINEISRTICYNQTVYDDVRLEADEWTGLTLQIGASTARTVTGIDQTAIRIIDDDVARVGIDPTFIRVDETVGFVEICAVVFEPVITCPIDFDFSVSLSTCDGTAETPMDYEAVDTILLFTACEIRACFNVGIVDDNIAELTERFSVKLNRTDGLDERITLDPIVAEVEIVDNDVEIGFERTVYTVTETEGSVEVCGIIYSSVLSRTVTVRVESSDGTAVETVNYQRIDMPLGPFTQPAEKICFNVPIMNNNVCNDDPNLNFTIEMSRQDPNDIGVNIVIPVTTIVIDDSMEPECNPIRVGYEMTTYTTTERMGYVELCAVVNSSSVGVVTPRPFVISATTVDETAVAPGDYDALNGFELAFNIGDNRVCHNVTINDDELCEQPAESFLSRLSYVSGQMPITIDPEEARVFIDDENEPECTDIFVGYEFTTYTTTESMGSVTLCATLFVSANGAVVATRGAPRPFTISATTRDGSAMAPGDYEAVVGEQLVFNTGDRRQCHTVNIVDDDDCEQPSEDFFSNLMYVSGVQTITVIRPEAQVIIDDTNEPECADIFVGYEFTTYTTTESVGSVTLCATLFVSANGAVVATRGAPRPFTISATTRDGSAIAPGDYGAVVGERLVFNTGDNRQCHTVNIVNDDECEEPAEDFFSNLELVSGVPIITVIRPEAQVFIDDTGEPECEPPAILVNDTLTGDPLMTVPILTEEEVLPGDVITSLCYEVHGQADYVFNLVSDTCVTVNAHYAKAPIASSNIDLNVVDAIGVRAVSNNGTCENIRVGLQGCQATVNDVDVNGMYRRDGISVREYANRVRIVVPNCADTDLVMWVFCMNGQTEDPVTWEFFDFDFIRFVVRRGLNLAEESHGLIGQFWNVPVELAKYTGDFGGVQRDDSYTITVKYPGNVARSFVGLMWSVTWEFERRPCLYVGNSQAGPLGEEDVDPNDSVIQGTYRDYRVDSMFSSDFAFSHFDETLCP